LIEATSHALPNVVQSHHFRNRKRLNILAVLENKMLIRQRFSLTIAVIFSFLWISSTLATSETRGIRFKLRSKESPGAPVAEEVNLYGSSYALVIGIDNYTQEWPRHSNAISDGKLRNTDYNRGDFVFLLASSGAVGSAKEIESDGRFVAYDNGTVKDTKTGLMWASKDNGYNINWHDAKRYCENYRGGGYKDWRMPTIDELAGLYDRSESYQAKQRRYNVYLTKLIQLTTCCSWASDTRGSKAAHFYFFSGHRGWGSKSGSDHGRALPVRGGN
jgi:hypothetical protein